MNPDTCGLNVDCFTEHEVPLRSILKRAMCVPIVGLYALCNVYTLLKVTVQFLWYVGDVFHTFIIIILV